MTRIHLLGGYFDSPWTVPEILRTFSGSIQKVSGQPVTGVAQLLQVTGHGKLRWRYVPVSALSDLEDLNEFTQEDYAKTVDHSIREARKAKAENLRVQREATQAVERLHKRQRRTTYR